MATTSQAQYGPVYDILIVDNKELTRDTVQKILQQEGYTVDTARHGKEGIEKVRASNYGYRLVITELIMPYAGGFEVIKTIKKESRIPVMVLSAVADEDTINESFRLSADDFLKKPFMASELVQRIQRLLIRHAAPVYPKTVVMPTPVIPVAPPVVATEEDRAVEAVVAKRKRSIKAAASTAQPKTVAIKKTPVSKKAIAAKVTVSKNPVKTKAEKEKVPAAVPRTKATAAKKANAKSAAAKTKTAVAKPKAVVTKTTKSATTAKKASAAPKKAAKKSETGKVKKAPVKKAAVGGKSKLIIRNSIPMIRRIPQITENCRQLKADSIGTGLCAIAV